MKEEEKRVDVDDQNGLSRRDFIVAAGAASALLATPLSGAFSGSKFEEPRDRRFDAVVISAGLAGLTAARELREAGTNSRVSRCFPPVGDVVPGKMFWGGSSAFSGTGKLTKLIFMYLYLILTALFAVLFSPSGFSNPADRVYTNGYIYTADRARTIAEAVAIRHGKIVAVGALGEVQAHIGPETKVEDLQGKLMLPGLQDTHIHALGVVAPDICDLQSKPVDLAGLSTIVASCIDHYAPNPGDWLIVVQWNFSEGNEPGKQYQSLRQALDAGAPENPVMLIGNDVHHGAVNSLALAAASERSGNNVPLNAETLNGVYSGYRELVAVNADGEPSGGITEGVKSLIYPSWGAVMIGADRDPLDLMPRIAAVLAENGITSIQDPAANPHSVRMYKTLEEMGGMSFRLRATIRQDTYGRDTVDKLPELVSELKQLRQQYQSSDLIRVNGVKVFADGVLEGNPYTEPPTLPNAATINGFLQPRFAIDADKGTARLTGYVDVNGPACREGDDLAPGAFLAKHGFSSMQCTKGYGVLEHTPQFIHEYIARVTEAGFNVHVHAISDKAIRVTTDAFAAAKASAEKHNTTQSLAHLQLVHPEDQKKIGELGIYTTFTFAWAQPVESYDLGVVPFIDKVSDASDMYNPEHYYIQNVYPANSIRKYGGIITVGSDAPVESRDPRPFYNIEKAVTRSNQGRVYNANERLSIEEVIEAYTINGAAMLGIAGVTGSIELGKQADLIVLNQNIIDLAKSGHSNEISETKVLVTLFDGEIVYRAPL